ncbi:MAG: hypothetical protein PVJ27_07815, partial [Candidatus Brocadiaceae bacterium]
MARDYESAPTRVTLLLRVAEAATRLGEAELAETALKEAAESAEQVEPADHLRQYVAEAYAAAGEPETARAIAGRVSDGREQTEAILRAAEALARAGRETDAREFAREAVEHAREQESVVQRNRLLTDAAQILGRLGRVQEARRTLKLIDARPRRVQSLLKLATVCDGAGQQEAAARLRQEATALVEDFAARECLTLLEDDGPAYAEAVAVGAALDFLRRAEEAARDLPTERARRTPLLRIGDAYGVLGQWQEAVRIATELDQPFYQAQYRLQHLLVLAEGGRTEPAVQMLESQETDFLQYAGRENLLELARFYRKTFPGAGARRISTIEPKPFREAVYGAFAEAAASEGNYERARSLAERITYRPDRARALQRVALAAIEASGPEPDAAGFRFAMDAVSGELAEPDTLDVLYRIGRRHLDAGHTGGVELIVSRMRGVVAESSYGETRALGLCLVSVLLDGLGRRDEALETVAEAMAAAEKIGCASCQDETLETAFGHFGKLQSVELVRKALEELDPPRNL